MVKNKTRMLLGLACVAAVAGVGVTAYATVSAIAVEPAGVAAVEGDSLATLDVGWSGSSSYEKHDATAKDGSEWSVTCGQSKYTGGNKNESPMYLGDNILVDGIGADEKYYSAVICETPVVNAGAFEYSFSTGKGSVSDISLVSSTDRNGTFTEVNLTSGSQGQNSESGRFEFEAITESTYFALILHNSSGYFRADNLTASIIEGATAGTPEDAKPVSLEISREEGKQSYYVDSVFDKAGYEVVLNYGSETDSSYSATSILDVDDSRLTWNYDLTTVGEGKELTVTFNEADIELTSNALTYDVLEAPDGQYYYFGKHTDFLNDWTNSYEKRTLAYEGEFSIAFSSADKNSSTITDMPVSKGGEATLTSLIPMSKIEFGFKQWVSKSNTASLYIDGGSTAVDSADFLDGFSSVSYVSDSPFFTAKVDWSNNNQVGWEYVYIEYASVEPSEAESYAEMFLESMKCDGKGAIIAEEGTWETLSDLYAGLSDSDKGILKGATPDENSESSVEQAVARYDYIVGKYGVEQYPDFMGRTPARIAEARSVDVNDQTAAWVIAGISAAGIASAAAFFFLRRRKEA